MIFYAAPRFANEYQSEVVVKVAVEDCSAWLLTHHVLADAYRGRNKRLAR